ncbi:MAG TPA: prepilin peptidase [Desulfomonilaceae bacterium]|nr:prepilin peptidase [Desulfomonilaceae bacterium]
MTGIYLVMALLGLSLGSFVGACAYRIPRHISIVAIPSACPECKTRLTWREKIPLLSFLVQRGRCRNCFRPISWGYPIVELVSSIGTVWLFMGFGLTIGFLVHWVFFLLMLLVCQIDSEFLIIPNTVLLCSLGMGIVFFALCPSYSLPEALLSSIISFAVLLSIRAVAGYLWGHECLGMGDVKLAGVLGFFLGLKLLLLTLWVGAVAGALYGLLRGREFRYSPLPFGSFLTVAAVPLYSWEQPVQRLISQWF